MRKLKLQMQLSVNGFVAGPNGELDWLTWTHDDELKAFITSLHTDVDTILMGRKLAEGFIPYWEEYIKNPETPDDFGHLMVDTPKVVFTKTLETSPWNNTMLAKGALVEEVTKLKNLPGQDMIVYGGATFVSDLIAHNLIDELNLFINPTAIGAGMAIFKERTNLQLLSSKSYSCGIVVLVYKPGSI